MCDINRQDLENIGFVISPSFEFIYYYDYDTNDATDYYQRQLYLKPPFENILKEVLAHYQDGFCSCHLSMVVNKRETQCITRHSCDN